MVDAAHVAALKCEADERPSPVGSTPVAHGSGSPSSSAAAAASTAISVRLGRQRAGRPRPATGTTWCRSASPRPVAGCSTDATPQPLRSPAGTLPEVAGRHRGGPLPRPDRPGAGRSRRARQAVPGCSASVDVVVPGAARAVRRGRHDPGAARDGRRALRGAGRVRQRGRRWTRSSPRSCCAAEGLPVGDYVVLAPRGSRPPRAPTSQRLGLPVFVKPARAGSSVGITKVTDWAELRGGRRARVRARPEGARRGRGRRAARSSAACSRTPDGVPEREPAGRDPGASAATTGTTSRPSTSTTPASSTSRPICPTR